MNPSSDKKMYLRSMNLVIDSGNTNIKLAYFEQGKLDSLELAANLHEVCDIARRKRFDKVIVSSVSLQYEEFKPFLTHTPVVYLDASTVYPIRSAYKTPSTLGVDRMAAATGAYTLFPGKDCFIINAGSCITYDFLDSHGVFQGGSIAPGLRMRLKAMNTFTARLPLPELNYEEQLPPGLDTDESMLTGVKFGMICEIEGFIRYYKNKYPEIQVILTGGDAAFFESNIKEPIFAVPSLVLEGLNRLLEFNLEG